MLSGVGVGGLVGVGVGEGDGVGLGVAVGVGVGAAVGIDVGDGVGLGVGDGEGVGVGTGPTFVIVMFSTLAMPGPWNSNPSGPIINKRVGPLPGRADPFTN